MDFFESAVALIGILTGVPANVYGDDLHVLHRFEQEYCFSAQLQGIYTETELRNFLGNGVRDLIYDLEEPLGSRLIIFSFRNRWVLLGPYVKDGWSRDDARVRLAKAGAPESIMSPFKAYRCRLPIAQRDRLINAVKLIVEQVNGDAFQKIQPVWAHTGSWDALAYSRDYENSAVVNYRYALEDQLVDAVSQGDWEAAHKSIEKMKGVTADLRFISDELQDWITGGATLRTMARMGAKQAGLNPVLIDSISQEYAQKMNQANSSKELFELMEQVTEHFCIEVQNLHNNNYHACVRLAMDYIGSNLSRQLTSAEIAKAAGVERHLLTKVFAKETGMTVKQYLTKQRCAIAAELLRSSEITIQEVASYVGYPDSNYFSRVFKTNQGISPHSYRRSYGISK